MAASSGCRHCCSLQCLLDSMTAHRRAWQGAERRPSRRAFPRPAANIGATAACSASFTDTTSAAGACPAKKARALSHRRSQCQSACCRTCTAPGSTTSNLNASPACSSALRRQHGATLPFKALLHGIYLPCFWIRVLLCSTPATACGLRVEHRGAWQGGCRRHIDVQVDAGIRCLT